ncbi:MAG: hypothetical protein CMQ41_05485 [Gammaproteobacteria bacterium]|nr:hypothetical protein [Gammaproteobacteria bacterium]
MPYINGLFATQAQRLALKQTFKFIQKNDDAPYHFAKPSYREFLGSVQGMIGDRSCLMVPFYNTWLGIEPDGYTHS